MLGDGYQKTWLGDNKLRHYLDNFIDKESSDYYLAILCGFGGVNFCIFRLLTFIIRPPFVQFA